MARFPSRFASALAIATLCLSACGGDDDGTPAEPDAGPPFEVAEREWVWFPVDGNQCMDGSATGIGLNLDYSSSKLMFILEEGGACFNGISCTDVSHPNGFGETDLTDWVAGQAGIADRSDASNPLADWSYVFVPYCTGDIHLGTNPDGLSGRKFVGHVNFENAAQLVAERFAGTLDQVLIAGQSAGGFGTLGNYDMVVDSFGGDTPVDVLNDSGQYMSDDYLNPCLQTLVRDLWNLEHVVPSDCADCTGEDGGGLSNLVDYYTEKYPDSRIGLISSYRDATIRRFYGFGYPSCENPTIPMNSAAFAEGVVDMRDNIFAPTDNARVYSIDDDGHVWTNQVLSSVSVDGVDLSDWISDLVNHEAGWDTVTPPPAN